MHPAFHSTRFDIALRRIVRTACGIFIAGTALSSALAQNLKVAFGDSSHAPLNSSTVARLQSCVEAQSLDWEIATTDTTTLADLLITHSGEQGDDDLVTLAEHYRLAGKDVLFLGARPGQLEPEMDWIPTARKQALLNTMQTLSVIDWSKQDLSTWTAELPPNTDQAITVTEDPKHNPMLVYRSSRQFQYALYRSPTMTLHDSVNTLLIEARAEGKLRKLLIEWDDQEGKRWVSLLPLAEDWTRYAVELEDFHPLHSSVLGEITPPLKPENVRGFRIGFAFNSTETDHAQIIEIRNIQLGARPASAGEPPVKALFAPEFTAASAFVPATAEAGVQATFVSNLNAARQEALLASPYYYAGHRPRALYPLGAAPGRWMPWVEMTHTDCPYPQVISSSWIDRHNSDSTPVWSHVGLNVNDADPDLLHACLDPILGLVSEGILLLQGGCDQYFYAPREPISFGVVIRNRQAKTKHSKLNASLTALDTKVLTQPLEYSTDLELVSGQTQRHQAAFEHHTLPAGEYRFDLTLSNAEGRILDRITHRLTIGTPAQKTPQDFVKVEQGQFMLDGKPWNAHGIHYWLPMVASQADPRLWHNWLSPELYDPDQAERDLRTMQTVGIRSVVIPYRSVEEAANLCDFLQLCDRFDIRSVVFIERAHPLEPNLKLLAQMVDAAQLDRQKSVFALDLAWEPHMGLEQERSKWNAAWTQWVIDQYGSLEAAENVWGFAPRREHQLLLGPLDDQLRRDGEWNAMVAAYRRFLDDLISRGYGQVTRLLRERCPGLLLGARTGYGGTGVQFYDAHIPFDLVSGAAHLDFISPEAYGLNGEWSGFLDGKVLTALARKAGHGKPVVWMEYGFNSFEQNGRDNQGQISYLQNMFRMIRESGSNASFAWWWPGGYRFQEASDYGLTDPDASPRPALFELARQSANTPPPSPSDRPDRTLTIDRDLSPRGISRILEQHRDAFIRLTDQGHSVAFVSPAEGTSTADMPLIGIGNIPAEHGGPTKYANAEFTQCIAEVKGGTNQVLDVNASPETQRMIDQSIVQLRIALINSGEAAWCTGDDSLSYPGSVALELRHSGRLIASAWLPAATAPNESAEFSIDLKQPLAPGDYSLRLNSARTGPFGQTLHFRSSNPEFE